MKAFTPLTLMLMLSAPAMAGTGPAWTPQRIELTQMDSPGDGLDPDSAAQGNGRPRGVAPASNRRVKTAPPVNKVPVKRHRSRRNG